MSTHDSSNGSMFGDIQQQMDTLLMLGAKHFDPAGYHLIEAMIRRSQSQATAVQRYMQPRIEKALQAFAVRFEEARHEAANRLGSIQSHFPLAAERAQHCFIACDFSALKHLHDRLIEDTKTHALSDLTQAMQGNALNDNDTLLESTDNGSLDALLKKQEKEVLQALGHTTAPPESARPELKAMQLFRDTWAKVSTERRVTKVVEHAPRDTGPLNSQTLVVRSLTAMREISPEYANRFVSYIDTLLWLERSSGRSESVPEKNAAGKSPAGKAVTAKTSPGRAPAGKTRAPRKRAK